MKKIIILSLCLVFLGFNQSAFAETTCYDVEGHALTKNINTFQQAGNISLLFTDQTTGEEINLDGKIGGMIIGFNEEEGAVLLSHTITSKDENLPFSVISINDKATFIGAPERCSIPVHETVTNIIAGTDFTENVISVNWDIYGSINYLNDNSCLAVPNRFPDISGEICLDHE